MSFVESRRSGDQIVLSNEHINKHFFSDYLEARDRFRTAARQIGWMLSQYALPGFLAPDGSALSCDVAIGGVLGAEHALVVSSGLHGVEGFFGSAVQCAWMTNGRAFMERHKVRFVLVHALNPYGYAFLRRCDQDNIDVNRNFLVDANGYRGHHPLYARLEELLNPRCPPKGWDVFATKTLVPILRFGFPALSQAVAEGQYDFPKGLFFGGQKSSWTRTLLESNLATWIGSATRIVHLDFHTGLGKWASHQLLIDYPLDDQRRSWFRERLADHSMLELSSNRAAYQNRGGLGAWCQHRFPHLQYVYTCAEFGTGSQLSVLAALRRENQATHWAAADDSRSRRAKTRLKNVFCPKSERWRHVALQGALDIIADALQAVESLPPADRKL